MAKKNFPITDPTGEKQTKKKRGRPKKNQVLDTAKQTLSHAKNAGDTVVDIVTGTTDKIADVTGKIGDTVQSVQNGIDRITSNFQASDIGNANSESLLKDAEKVAKQYGLEQLDIKGKIPSDPYKASSNLPEMSSKDADKEILKIIRQRNAVRVATNNEDLTGDVLDWDKKRTQNIGKAIDASTEKIKVGRKLVTHQTEITNLKSDQTKLKVAEEEYQQNLIKLGGVIQRTDEIRLEQQRRFDLLQAKNRSLLIQIESQNRQNMLNSAEEIEAYLEAD